MRGRGKSDWLDRRLRSERPQPREEFVSTLADRLGPESAPRRPLWRTAAAAGFTTLLVLAFALTGGIGYAANAVQGGTTAVTSLVTGPSKAVKAKRKALSSAHARNRSVTKKQLDPAATSLQTTTPLVRASSLLEAQSSAANQYQEKVLVCHQWNTISVNGNAVPSHLAHGDTLGPCGPG